MKAYGEVEIELTALGTKWWWVVRFVHLGKGS
jgi:hypothetical protein